ncbi:MAG: class I SAM-dependent methyltransferase [Proteobacteria bacterium]|nr:class I SAM-dependent methyltransferase [Pseudomonadota bacterium]
MFSYVFMKLLEGRPPSYDQRMNKVSGGRVLAIKELVASAVPPGSHILEIGCGTGELASMLIGKGHRVLGFDLSPSMVKAARQRIAEEGLEGQFHVRRLGVDAMDQLGKEDFDAVVSTLVFSELTSQERTYALKEAARTLRDGGTLIIADEIVAGRGAQRLAQVLFRLPTVAATYLVTGSTTHPIPNLSGEIERAGFNIDKEELSHGGTFALVIAHRVRHRK